MSDRLLAAVEKPARYSGGEWNEIRKNPAAVRTKVVLAYPDLYEIGMSYLGQKILYAAANARPDILAERVFAPWPDYEAVLRAAGEPLRSLENKLPLAAFDIVAFSLLYELNDSNILTILDLGGIPVEAQDRDGRHPLVVAGGPAAFNPEPLAGIFDAFFIGDGEEGFLEIIDAWDAACRRGCPRPRALAELADIPGVYVPSLYEEYSSPGSPLLAVRPRKGTGAPATIEKRMLRNFARSPFPERILVPNIQAVFDRVAVEVARGCPQKCRFCQATSLYHPHRPKDPELVVRTVLRSLDATGFEDASLFALSVGDYPCLERMVESMMDKLTPRKVALSLSSLRPKKLSSDIVESITRVRKTGFTLVPEAGTERLRRVINKHLDDKDLWAAADHAFRRGWRLLKLYFMVGLPTETEEDVAAIPALVRELSARGRAVLGGPPRIHLSLASFIPKPHTPFQWMGMDEAGSLLDKQYRIKTELKRERSVEIKVHDVRGSLLEASFSRGDRHLQAVLLEAWRRGARFDGWSDQFKPDLWDEAFAKTGVDSGVYRRPFDLSSPLPWDHLSSGMTRKFFLQELKSALNAEFTPSCDDRACGECRGCASPVAKRNHSGESLEVHDSISLPLGMASADVMRYAVFYGKDEAARFLGHNDLVRSIQRVFRRAGVEVQYSEGFHPKPIFSFGPALPLGMRSREEFLEFKSKRILDNNEFLERTNAVSLAGIEFLRLVPISTVTPSFMNRIREIIYSLDLGEEDVKSAVRRSAEARGGDLRSETLDEAALKLFREPGVQSDFPWLIESGISPAGSDFVFRIAFNPQKIPRPQDLVFRALGLEKAVTHMTRVHFIFS